MTAVAVWLLTAEPRRNNEELAQLLHNGSLIGQDFRNWHLPPDR